MSLVKKEHEEVIEAYDLLNDIKSIDLGRPFLEVDKDPGDEVTEGFSAVVAIYPDDEENIHYLGSWAETPVDAAKGLIDTLKKEGFIS